MSRDLVSLARRRLNPSALKQLREEAEVLIAMGERSLGTALSLLLDWHEEITKAAEAADGDRPR